MHDVTITIDKLHEENRALERDQIKMVDTVHLATDGWTGNDNSSLITVTSNFTNNECQMDLFLDTHELGNVSHTGDN